jgi:hypothetical protein
MKRRLLGSAVSLVGAVLVSTVSWKLMVGLIAYDLGQFIFEGRKVT